MCIEDAKNAEVVLEALSCGAWAPCCAAALETHSAAVYSKADVRLWAARPAHLQRFDILSTCGAQHLCSGQVGPQHGSLVLLASQRLSHSEARCKRDQQSF